MYGLDPHGLWSVADDTLNWPVFVTLSSSTLSRSMLQAILYHTNPKFNIGVQMDVLLRFPRGDTVLPDGQEGTL